MTTRRDPHEAPYGDAAGDQWDRGLVDRHQAGDHAAFEALYVRHYGRLLRYCVRRMGDSHGAEEVAQEAFLSAFLALERMGGERRFYPWLTVIARRLIIDRQRHERHAIVTSEPDLGLALSAEDEAERRLQHVHLAQALDRLRERYRDVIELRDVQGHSYDQIAEVLGVTAATVPPLLHRARVSLRREFRAASGDRVALWGWPSAVVASVRRLRDRLAQWTSALPEPSGLAVPGAALLLAVSGTVLQPFAPPAPDAPGQARQHTVDAAWVQAAASSREAHGRSGPQPGPRPGRDEPTALPTPFGVDDLASFERTDDPEQRRRWRERDRQRPLYLEAGPITIAMDPDEDRRYFQELLGLGSE